MLIFEYFYCGKACTKHHGHLKTGLKGNPQMNWCKGNAVTPESTIPKVSATLAMLKANNLFSLSICRK